MGLARIDLARDGAVRQGSEGTPPREIVQPFCASEEVQLYNGRIFVPFLFCSAGFRPVLGFGYSCDSGAGDGLLTLMPVAIKV